MRQRVMGLRWLVATPTREKLVKYLAASGVNVVVAEGVLAFAFGVLHWSARPANVLAATLATIPAYWLARRWVWGRSGPSHMVREVLPFWALAFVALALTTWIAGVAESVGVERGGTRLEQTLIVSGSVFVMSAFVWVAKFILLNKFLFADRGSPPEDKERPPLDDAMVTGSAS